MKLTAVVAGVSLLGSGCSFVFVTSPPPPSPARRGVTCSGSPLPPILDAAAALTGGYIAFDALLGLPGHLTKANVPDPGETLLGLVALGLFGASAGWGLVAGAACREVKAEDPPKRRKRWGAQQAEEAEEEAAAEARARELARQREAAAPDGDPAPSGVPEPVVPAPVPDGGAR